MGRTDRIQSALCAQWLFVESVLLSASNSKKPNRKKKKRSPEINENRVEVIKDRLRGWNLTSRAGHQASVRSRSKNGINKWWFLMARESRLRGLEGFWPVEMLSGFEKLRHFYRHFGAWRALRVHAKGGDTRAPRGKVWTNWTIIVMDSNS